MTSTVIGQDKRVSLRFGNPTRRGEQDAFSYADDDRRWFNPQAQSAEIGPIVALSLDVGWCSRRWALQWVGIAFSEPEASATAETIPQYKFVLLGGSRRRR